MTELEKAARMALEALDSLLDVAMVPMTCEGLCSAESVDKWHDFSFRRDALRTALTQALATTAPVPASQQATLSDDELPGMWSTSDLIGGETDTPQSTPERKGEPVYMTASAFVDGKPYNWREVSKDFYDIQEDRCRRVLYTSPQAPEGVQWLTVAEHGLPAVGEEVIGGHWYTDPWLKPECATRFVWCVCQVVADDHPDFPDGKRWHTFGPAYSHITHWARLNLPAIDAARKEHG